MTDLKQKLQASLISNKLQAEVVEYVALLEKPKCPVLKFLASLTGKK